MIKKVMSTAFAVALTVGVSAQSNQLSFGADVGLPIGDFGDVASLLVGPNVGFELPVGDNIGLTAQVGYDFVSTKSEFSDFIDSQSLIPAQVGVKYYVTDNQEGVYVHGQVGIHSATAKTADITILGVTVPGTSTTNTNLSYAGGVGYMLEQLDFALRYNAIAASEGGTTSSYIALRIAYLLNLGN